jgi:periplasmic divalent cation tolerance protein
MDPERAFLVYVTYPDRAGAESLGKKAVEARLAACVNLLPGMTSFYEWEGVIAEESETVLLMKTRETRVAALVAWVKLHHPYQCPCIVSWPIALGFDPFLEWIRSQTSEQICP